MVCSFCSQAIFVLLLCTQLFFFFFPVHRMGIVREGVGEFANGLVNFSNGLHTCSSTGTLHLH